MRKDLIEHFVKFDSVFNSQLVCFELWFVLHVESFKKILILVWSANADDDGESVCVIKTIGNNIGVMVSHSFWVYVSIEIV